MKKRIPIMAITKQAGSMLLNALVGVALFSAVSIGGVKLWSAYSESQTVGSSARHMDEARLAGERYAKKFGTNLQNGQSIPGFAIATAPTAAELIAASMLPTGYSDAGILMPSIKFSVATVPAGCTGTKCGLIIKSYASDSILGEDKKADSAMASKIAQAIKDGYGWTNAPSDASKLQKNGVSLPNPLGNKAAVVFTLEWLGSNVQSATVPPVSFNYRDIGCPAGYDGYRTQQQTVTTDKMGNVTTSGWVTIDNECTATPPPTCANGASNYPICTPPTCPNGASDYPTCTPTVPVNPPTCANGASNYPTCTPPAPNTCANGASNYPTCTPPTCSNGATNYPTCTPNIPVNPPTCANGATNYPTCTFPQPPQRILQCTGQGGPQTIRVDNGYSEPYDPSTIYSGFNWEMRQTCDENDHNCGNPTMWCGH